MNRLAIGLVIGVVLGAAITGLIIWNVMPSMMLSAHESTLPFDETVTYIEQASTDMGWQVPKIYDIQTSLHKAGYEDFGRLKILSMCQPHHAHGILADDNNKMVSSMMPCRIGVFEDKDGKVMISQMNIGLMSKMFGGTIEEVMGKVAGEEHEMLKKIMAQ